MTTKEGLEFTHRVDASDGGWPAKCPGPLFRRPGHLGAPFGLIEFAVFRWNLQLILKNSKDSSSFFKDARKSAKETQRFSKIPKISQCRDSALRRGSRGFRDRLTSVWRA